MPAIADLVADLLARPRPVLCLDTCGLTAALAALAGTILGSAAAPDRDEASVCRALDRVHNKVRPSHAGMLKDSIHLEHYLDLSRQLHASGFPRRRVFVSANKADFWE